MKKNPPAAGFLACFACFFVVQLFYINLRPIMDKVKGTVTIWIFHNMNVMPQLPKTPPVLGGIIVPLKLLFFS